ncbi:2-carboxy-1,4-naphthoquinone phytyltransferase [Candidatus Synechococcus spongiarum]|uniref:2-carboxy-1,4-naphthoquinone phytyltransferase n=1 Tax=Candidatus Synechococcus spongiarum TaxID=431041 RepID=A0A171DHB8_9SYNE|nr:2-carboxy-1,4-naphthoquinone phytyltransferase [Candidatus Synechococcus spongiarum]SAY39187.1 1,4-dihydroxy-2-naphthoate polyprenyltransferase (EC 2.5.1.74) [Candidatus Synechococcus spongiarum]
MNAIKLKFVVPSEVAEQQRRLWRAAVKWPMYAVAVMPALVAAGWLLGPGRSAWRLQPQQLALFLLAAVLLLAWENVCNDYFDAQTGVDVHKPHSLIQLTGAPRLVLMAAQLCCVLGLLLMVQVAMASSWWLLPLVLASCCCGYLYQGPPFRLGYQGLGEPLCWLAFGPLATAAALVGLGAPALGPEGGGPLDLSLASQLGCGPALATTLVLFCSHFHQVEDDLAHGKRSPVQKLGTARAAALVPWLVAVALLAEVMPVAWGAWPPTVLLALASLPVALPLIRLLGRHHHQPERISHSKFLALRFQMANGVLFAGGLALGAFTLSS